MTVTRLRNNSYTGLSGDTKPTTAPASSTFLETDTGLTKLYNGSSWVDLFQSSTETLTNKTIDGGLNVVRASSNADVYVYIDVNDSNKYKARMNKSGNVYSSTTDAATPINSAITELGSAGGTIFIGPGTFAFTAAAGGSPAIGAGVGPRSWPLNFIGSGRGRTIFSRQMGSFGAMFLTTADHVTFAHFTIDGNYVYPTFVLPTVSGFTQYPGAEIQVQGLDTLVYDVEIRNSSATGGGITNYGTATIENCTLYGSNTANGYVPPHATLGYGASVSGCGVEAFGGGPNQSVLYTVVKNCDIQWWSSNAMLIEGRGLVDGNYIDNNGINSGGQVATIGNLAIKSSMVCINNMIKKGLTGASGFEIANAAWLVQNNVVDGVPNWGAAIEWLSGAINNDIIVQGNYFKNCGIEGIGVMTGPSQYVILKGNICSDDGLGQTDDRFPALVGSNLPPVANTSVFQLGGSFNTRVGERIVDSSSALFGKVISIVSFFLKRVGNPTGTISCVVRKGSDDSIASTLSTLNAASVSTTLSDPPNTGFYYFLTSSTGYTTVAGDKISIEYSGGDVSNYIEVHYDPAGGFDSTHSDAFNYNGSYTFTTTADMAGVWRCKFANAFTQQNGIRVWPFVTDHYIIKDNILYGNTAFQLRDQGTGIHKIVSNNDGYTSEASGTKQFTGDSVTTLFQIPHGLSAAPNYVSVTPASTDTIGSFYVTSDSTNINVNYGVAPHQAGANNLTFYWRASISGV